jgi:hypothetical protein
MSVKPIDIPIIGGSNNLPQDDTQYTLNMYAEKVSDEVYTLKPTPGTTLYAQFAVGGGGRGLLPVGSRLFGVRGGYFQEIVSGLPVTRGLLNSNLGKVGMTFNLKPDDNTGQVMIVDGDHGYVFDLQTNAFSTLTGMGGDNFLGGGSQVCFCAGRAFVFKPGSTLFQCSDLYDFTTWNTTQNTAMQTLNTPLLAIISNGTLLYGFSSDGFEVWEQTNIDTVDIFPLRQVLAGDRIGILAPQSALFSERYAYWLGGNAEGQGVAYRHQGGGRPERITDHSNERNIAAMITPQDALGFTYQALGHTFYGLNFQAGNRTLVFDSTTNLWHDRCQREPVSGKLNFLPFTQTALYDGRVLAVGIQDGIIWQLDETAFTDNGDPIVRERITGVVPKEGDFLAFGQSVELFGEVGNTPIGQPDPQLMMKYSIDRGKTWSLEDWQQVGGNGSYEGRTRWVGLGAAYGFCFWFRIVAAQYISWRMLRLRME